MLSSYNRALTIFSDDGKLFQTEYALEASKCSATIVALQSSPPDPAIIIGVEKFEKMILQKQQSSKKVVMIDEHVACAFAGRPADARLLIQKAQVECQSHRLTYEDPISVENIARYIATIMLKCTQYGGVRPFGVSMLICGFDSSKKPHIYQTLPSGHLSEWKACGIGKYERPIQEYLEKLDWDQGFSTDETIKTAITALRENCSCKNIEIAELKYGETGPVFHILTDQEIEEHANNLE